MGHTKYHKAANQRMWPVVAGPTQTKRGLSNEIQKRLGKPATSLVGFLVGPRTLTLAPNLMTI